MQHGLGLAGPLFSYRPPLNTQPLPTSLTPSSLNFSSNRNITDQSGSRDVLTLLKGVLCYTHHKTLWPLGMPMPHIKSIHFPFKRKPHSCLVSKCWVCLAIADAKCFKFLLCVELFWKMNVFEIVYLGSYFWSCIWIWGSLLFRGFTKGKTKIILIKVCILARSWCLLYIVSKYYIPSHLGYPCYSLHS